MRKFIRFLLLAGSLCAFSSYARAEHIEGLEITSTALPIDSSQTINMSNYLTAAVQAVYAGVTPSSHTLSSGVKPSATITVSTSSANLISAKSSVTINVRSTSSVLLDAVTLNGLVFKEGTNWRVGSSTITSAANLAAVIDASSELEATVSGATVTVKYYLYGTVGNGLPVTTTDAVNLAISAATFTAGIDRHTITVNNVTLTESTDFNANSSSQTTAHNIVTAINANTTLNTQVLASSSAAVVTITAIVPIQSSYNISASTTALATVGFSQGANPDINITSDRFTRVNHTYNTGLRVQYVTNSGTAPGGLTTGTTYFVIRVNDDIYKLATTSTTAAAGTAIDITTLPTTISTYGIIPMTFAVGSSSFKWQASNDGANFTDLSISSVTIQNITAGGNSIWDLDDYAYKYLRMVFIGPTSGGVSLNVRVYGREE